MSNLFKPTKRIEFLLEQLPRANGSLDGPATELWDIGCDHGLLGLTAVVSGRVRRVHLVDPAISVIENLRSTLNSPKYKDWWREHEARVQLVLARGEDVIGDARGAIVIAGIGGETMVKILEHVQSFECLVLNPVSHVDEAQAFLESRNWRFQKVSVVDRSIKYDVFVVGSISHLA